MPLSSPREADHPAARASCVMRSRRSARFEQAPVSRSERLPLMGQSCTPWCTRVRSLGASYPGLLLCTAVRSSPAGAPVAGDRPRSRGIRRDLVWLPSCWIHRVAVPGEAPGRPSLRRTRAGRRPARRRRTRHFLRRGCSSGRCRWQRTSFGPRATRGGVASRTAADGRRDRAQRSGEQRRRPLRHGHRRDRARVGRITGAVPRRQTSTPRASQ